MRPRTIVVNGDGDTRLRKLTLEQLDSGDREVVPADALFVMIGADPHTGWLPPEIARDDNGFILTGPDIVGPSLPRPWPLQRLPLGLETSLPGVFAAGDVRTDSVKRVASAVGEGAVAVRLVQQHLAATRSAGRLTPPPAACCRRRALRFADAQLGSWTEMSAFSSSGTHEKNSLACKMSRRRRTRSCAGRGHRFRGISVSRSS